MCRLSSRVSSGLSSGVSTVVSLGTTGATSATTAIRTFMDTKEDQPFTDTGHIKAVIFDLGNVLIKSHSRKMASRFSKSSLLFYCMERRKLSDLQYTLFSIMEANHGKGIHTTFPLLFEKWMLDEKSNGELLRITLRDIENCKEVSKHVKTLLNDLVTVMFDPVQFAEVMNLHAGSTLVSMFPGKRKYLMSNYNGVAYNYVAKKYPELMGQFSDVLVSGKEKMMKPQREIYELAIARWNLEPGEVLYIDDDIANVQIAKELGFETVHFTTFESAKMSIQGLMIRS